MDFRKFLSLIIVSFSFFFSCEDGNNVKTGKTGNPEKGRGGQTVLQIERFESDLFALKSETFDADTLRLKKKYGKFFNIYCEQITKIGGMKTPMFRETLLGFINQPDIQSVQKEISTQYADVSWLGKELGEAFVIFKKIFPDSTVPKIYTMFSGFSYAVATTDSALAIGLDLYLGKNSRFYELNNFPKYKVEKMRRELMVSDAIRGFLISSFPYGYLQKDMISQMLDEGKILYLTAMMLPNEPEHNILGYKPEELTWCKQNESKIWSHFIDKQLFYSTDFEHEIGYLRDGPFTKGFPEKAPARIGVWLGYQIIKKFMEKNEDTTLPELFKLKDAHKIFSNSGYKPGRA